MAIRKGITPGKRFAILVRDGHRCRYCGATAAEVGLVVDHIIPVKQGGTNDAENLLCACRDCNAGKAAKQPAEAAPTPSDVERIYNAVYEQAALADQIREASASRQEWRQTICNYYCDLRGVTEIDRSTLTTFGTYAELHGIDNLYRWMDIAVTRLKANATDREFGRYISGIRRNEIEQASTVPDEDE